MYDSAQECYFYTPDWARSAFVTSRNIQQKTPFCKLEFVLEKKVNLVTYFLTTTLKNRFLTHLLWTDLHAIFELYSFIFLIQLMSVYPIHPFPPFQFLPQDLLLFSNDLYVNFHGIKFVCIISNYILQNQAILRFSSSYNFH